MIFFTICLIIRSVVSTQVVDDLGVVRKLAAENGTACDAFVEVVIRDRKTGADAVTSKPAVEAGDSLCEVLKRGG